MASCAWFVITENAPRDLRTVKTPAFIEARIHSARLGGTLFDPVSDGSSPRAGATITKGPVRAFGLFTLCVRVRVRVREREATAHGGRGGRAVRSLELSPKECLHPCQHRLGVRRIVVGCVFVGEEVSLPRIAEHLDVRRR